MNKERLARLIASQPSTTQAQAPKKDEHKLDINVPPPTVQQEPVNLMSMPPQEALQPYPRDYKPDFLDTSSEQPIEAKKGSSINVPLDMTSMILSNPKISDTQGVEGLANSFLTNDKPISNSVNSINPETQPKPEEKGIDWGGLLGGLNSAVKGGAEFAGSPAGMKTLSALYNDPYTRQALLERGNELDKIQQASNLKKQEQESELELFKKKLPLQTASDIATMQAKAGFTPPESLSGYNYKGQPVEKKFANGKMVYTSNGVEVPASDIKTNAVNTINVKQGLGGTSTDPDAIDFAAQMYLKTGQMPSLGMGNANARMAILSRAAQMSKDNGQNIGDVLAGQVAFGSNKAASNKLQVQKSTIGAFERNAEMALDNVMTRLDKISDSKVPIINSALRKGQLEISGDKDLASFYAALQTAINEYAKVTNSTTGAGVTSDTARKEIERLMSGNFTKEQFKEVYKVLKQDMSFRMKGYEQEQEALGQNISGNKKSNLTAEEQKELAALEKKYGAKK